MIGYGPPAVYVLAKSSAASYAAGATPTAAIPATGPDQAKLRLISRSPLPLVPSTRFAAGTRALANVISAFGVSRCPVLLIRAKLTPGVPRSSMIADSPSVPQYQTGMRPSPFTSTVQAKPGSTAQSSSAAMITSTFESPPPPYSAGSMPNAIPRLYASTYGGFVI